MRTWLPLLVVSILTCQNQSLQADKNGGDLFLDALTTDISGASPTLIGGDPVDPKDWPATVYSSQGNSRCTATIVGDRVLSIAAHCVGNGRSATFKLITGESYSSVCTHSPKYRGNSTADWALCLVDRSITGIKFEIVAQDAALLKVGEDILLTGFGCTAPNGSGGNDGVYRAGKSTVISLPSGNDNDIVTQGKVALCYGDSGGPAFKVLPDGKRYQLSINSRGNIRDTSYLSSIYTIDAKEFFASWSKEKKVKICGIHEDAENCRGVDAPPQHKLPEWCRTALEKMLDCLYGSPAAALKEPESCRKAHADLFACEEMAEREEN